MSARLVNVDRRTPLLLPPDLRDWIPAGRALYALRKQTAEPVFGIVKDVMGFRQFLLRGLEKVEGEWQLVALAYNMKRLWNLKMAMG